MGQGTDALQAFVRKVVRSGLADWSGRRGESAVQPRTHAAGMVSTEVDDTWKAASSGSGSESAVNEKPTASDLKTTFSLNWPAFAVSSGALQAVNQLKGAGLELALCSNLAAPLCDSSQLLLPPFGFYS